jgi:hypothetical protein
LFETVFVELGWSKIKGEVIPQKEIPIGAANKLIPDIIISTKGEYLFVVEMKKPSRETVERYHDQLRSYMLQLKLALGVFIGESIQVFYDDPDDNEQPFCIATVPFEKESADGLKLFGLLSKEGYSAAAVAEYYKECKAAQSSLKQANQLIAQLSTEQGSALQKGLLETYVTEKYGSSVAKTVLESVTIKIVRKNASLSHEQKTQNESPAARERRSENTGATEDDGLKIGKYVQDAFRQLFSRELLTEEDLANLCDSVFSNRELGTGKQYPVLREIQDGMSVIEARSDQKGRTRYYSSVFTYGNRRFVLSSQWFPRQREQLEQYMESKGL